MALLKSAVAGLLATTVTGGSAVVAFAIASSGSVRPPVTSSISVVAEGADVRPLPETPATAAPGQSDPTVSPAGNQASPTEAKPSPEPTQPASGGSPSQGSSTQPQSTPSNRSSGASPSTSKSATATPKPSESDDDDDNEDDDDDEDDDD